MRVSRAIGAEVSQLSMSSLEGKEPWFLARDLMVVVVVIFFLE